MTTVDKAYYLPEPPPILWAKSLTNPWELPWRPGFAAWHRRHKVWARLVAEDYYGETHPDDAIAFGPKHVEGGVAAALAARVEELEETVRRLLRGR